jgi:hypothetical protein
LAERRTLGKESVEEEEGGYNSLSFETLPVYQTKTNPDEILLNFSNLIFDEAVTGAARRLGSWIQIPLVAWMYARIFSVSVFLCG